MFCHKCGTKISSDDANFCINCKEPLIKIPASAKAEGRDGVPHTQNSDFDGMPSSVSIDFGDGDEALRLSDPIDFLMNEEQTDQAVPPEVDHDKPEPEAATDRNIKQQNDNDTGIIKTGDDPVPQTAPDNCENELPGKDKGQGEKPKKDIPPVLKDIGKDDPNDGENIRATSKIKLDKLNKPVKPKGETNPPTAKVSKAAGKNDKLSPDSAGLDINKIKQSSGVVYLSGNSLTFAGGAKILPGDSIQVGEKSYEVKLKPKNNANLYGMIGSVVAAVLITLYYLGAFNGAPNGSLVGMVLGGPDKRPLADQEVKLLEIDETVRTNNAGFFIFNNVPTGIYTVEYLDNGEKIGEERITVLGDKVSAITLSESEPEPVADSRRSQTEPKRARTMAKQAKAKTAKATKTAKKKEPGTLKLTLKPRGVRAYLDGKPLGKGTNRYKVRPGKYILSVKKKGYKTQSKKIIIKPDKTLSYSFSLKKNKDKKAKKTNGELAYENEIAGNYDEALRYYDKVLKKNSRDISALLGKARSYKAQNLMDKAITNYMHAANVASEKDDFNSQYDALTGIIEIRPNTFTAYNRRGDLLYAMGDYGRAAEDYLKIIEFDKRNLSAYYKLGNSYFKNKQYSEALTAYHAAEELHFADPKAQVLLAKTYYAMNDKKNAKKSYEKFMELANYSTMLEYKKDNDWQKVLNYLNVKTNDD